MKNKFIKAILILIALATLIGIYKYFFYRPEYYEVGNEYIYVKVGETFKIKMYENASTGYLECWLNENKPHLIVPVKSDFEGKGTDCIGCGGDLILSFKAVKKGNDTLKFASCPAGREGKSYSYYTEKNTTPQQIYTIKITE